MNHLFLICGFFAVGHLGILWFHPWVKYFHLVFPSVLVFSLLLFSHYFNNKLIPFYLEISKARILTAVVGVLLGVAHGYFHIDHAVDSRLSEQWHGEYLIVEGQIATFPKVGPRKTAFELELRCVNDRTGICIPSNDLIRQDSYLSNIRRIKVNLYAGFGHDHQPPVYLQYPLEPGENVRLGIKLKIPRGLANQNGFDYGRWLMQRGIHALANGKLECFLQDVCERLSPPEGIWKVRLHIADKIQSLFSDFPKTQQFLSALWLANKSNLDTSMQEAFTSLGLSHLLAISGLHIGMIAVIGFYLGKCLWALIRRRFEKLGRIVTQRTLSSAMSIVFALFYAALAGFTVPTLRALIMLIISVVYLNRLGQVPVYRLVVWSLVLVLLIQPLSPLGLGFWLSFVAVCLLGLIFANRNPQLPFFIGLILAQLLLGLGMNLVILPTHAWNPFSFFANLIVIPYLQFILMPGSLVLLLVDTVAQWLLQWRVGQFVLLNFGTLMEFFLVSAEKTTTSGLTLLIHPLLEEVLLP